MAAPSKILLIGPPAGQIKSIISKVSAIQAKHGPFSALFVVGDFFTPISRVPEQAASAVLSAEEEELLDGKLALPIPTYIMLGTSALPSRVLTLLREQAGPASAEGAAQPVQLAENLFFLGKSGVVDAAGFRVAICGGAWSATEWASSVQAGEISAEEDLVKPFITKASVSRLLSHPSFVAPPPPPSSGPSRPSRQPTTLAEAKAQAKEVAAAAAPADTPSHPARPPVDLLLTAYWPTGVTLHESAELLPHSTSRMWGAPPLASLARSGLIRYFFSLAPGPRDMDSNAIIGLDEGASSPDEGPDVRDNGVFWERTAYANNQPDVTPSSAATRFVSLARFANPKKKRWFMALNLVPASNAAPADSASLAAQVRTAQLSAKAGPSPFVVAPPGGSAKRTNADDDSANASADDSGPNFRWAGMPTKGKRARREGGRGNGVGTGANAGAASRGWGGNLESTTEDAGADGEAAGGGDVSSSKPHGLPARPNVPIPRKEVLPVGPDDCWFCLSNPQCAKHLIVAIGTECYVALPKGQLPPSSDPLSPVPGGGHVLVIPIAHFPSLLGADSDTAQAVSAELTQWRTALAATYAAYDAVVVSWEIGMTAGTRAGHTQMQFVPVPAHLAQGLEAAFTAAGEREGYEWASDEEVRRALAFEEHEKHTKSRADYFRLDIDGKTRMLFFGVGGRFNMQFARRTLAQYLNVPDRADWRKCARSEAVEEAEKTAFKDAFDEFAKDIGA